MSVKFPFFWGGGGGSADFIFMGARIFLKEKCAKLVQKHFRDLRVISPQNCVKIVRAQLLHNFCAKKWGSRTIFAQFFGAPCDSGWVGPAHNFCTIFPARCNFLKICGCTGQRCLNASVFSTHSDTQAVPWRGSPLQNLVTKFFPEISPVLVCRVMRIQG